MIKTLKLSSFVLIFIFSCFAQSTECDLILKNDALTQSLGKQLARLNQSLLQEFLTLSQVEPLILRRERQFLFLKHLEYEYSSDYFMVGRSNKLLTEKQILLLHSGQKTLYDLNEATSEEATQFFTNSIRTQMLRLVLPLISLWAEETSDNQRKELDKNLVKDFFESQYTSIAVRSFSPQDFENLILERPWQSVRAADIKVRLERWSNEGSHLRTFTSLHSCCKTNPGCRLCPVNRIHSHGKH